MPDRPRRSTEAGVTLLETLVVLVMLSVVAGSVALSVSGGDRRTELATAADLLARRVQIAADRALLTGQDAALQWTDRTYRFVIATGDGWGEHPVPQLGTTAQLQAGLSLSAAPPFEGLARISSDLRPPQKRTLVLRMASRQSSASVTFDGASARVVAARP